MLRTANQECALPGDSLPQNKLTYQVFANDPNTTRSTAVSGMAVLNSSSLVSFRNDIVEYLSNALLS
jgi:hypothetical protein